MSELKVSVFGFRLAKEDIKGRGIKNRLSSIASLLIKIDQIYVDMGSVHLIKAI